MQVFYSPIYVHSNSMCYIIINQHNMTYGEILLGKPFKSYEKAGDPAAGKPAPTATASQHTLLVA